MRIRIVAAGSRQPSWVEQGVREYTGRMPRQFKLEFVGVALRRRSRNSESKVARQDEGKRMLSVVRDTDIVVALEVHGDHLSTEALATRLDGWLQSGRDLVFLIGGPDGLEAACLERADFNWSLSRLTYPHGLVRILLAEQLYRAWTILTHHPYHRA